MPPVNSPSQQNHSTPPYLLPPPTQGTSHPETSQPQHYRPEDLSRFDFFLESRENVLRAGGVSSSRHRTLPPPSAQPEPPRLPVPQMMARTLPPPETEQIPPNYRPYGTRPPRRQSLYDWSPPRADPFTPFTANLLDSDIQHLVGLSYSAAAEDLEDDVPSHRRRLMRRRNRTPQDTESILERAMRLRRFGRNDYLSSRMTWRDARNASVPLLSNVAMDLSTVIRYLSKIRFCRSKSESLTLASKMFDQSSSSSLPSTPGLGVDTTSEDLLTNVRCLKVAKTSWLRPGAMFKGSQTTDPVTNCGDSALSSTVSSPSPAQKDWMVTVKITGVDYDNMTLTGTMEANGVWGPQDNVTKTITTYLEGEIIDFKEHTLQTVNFTVADNLIDATYWASLEPLRSRSKESLPSYLCSKTSMKQLSEEWVFMRWKEKCFLNADGPSTEDSATDGSNMLTISGFYFLTMRRSDGKIQGLYYDPQAHPHQELTLKPVNSTFPTYKFR